MTLPHPDDPLAQEGIEVHWQGKVIVICACENQMEITKPGEVIHCLVCDRFYRLDAEVKLGRKVPKE